MRLRLLLLLPQYFIASAQQTWQCLLQLIQQYFIAGDTAGVAMSVTAGNTLFYRW